jgi:hypothetical protein
MNNQDIATETMVSASWIGKMRNGELSYFATETIEKLEKLVDKKLKELYG